MIHLTSQRPNFCLFLSLLFTVSILHVCFARPIELSGEQDGLYEKATYLVTADIVVKEGQTLMFAPGTRVMFQRYTGIKVDGEIICRGDSQSPVWFTSESDSAGGSPQKFQWNGISVSETGCARFGYVAVAYSTYGIEVAQNGCVELDDVTFVENGRASLSIGGSVLDVSEDTPYTFSTTPFPPVDGGEIESAVSSTTDTSSDDNDSQSRKRPGWRIPVRIAGGVIAAGGVVAGILFYRSAVETDNEYDVAVAPQATRLGEELDDAELGMKLSVIPIAVGAVAVGVSFIPHKDRGDE